MCNYIIKHSWLALCAQTHTYSKSVYNMQIIATYVRIVYAGMTENMFDNHSTYINEFFRANVY